MNSRFFDVWSADMAYILGYFLGDGSISDRRKRNKRPENTICIYFYGHIDDVALLQIIKDRLGVSTPIRFRRYDKVVEFTFCSIYVGERLRSLGKGINGIFWPEVPKAYKWDFVRGFLDSDGSVSRSKKGCLLVGFTSMSKEFITQLRDEIYKLIGVKVVVGFKKETGGFRLGYGGSTALKLLQSIDNVRGMKLQRKWNLVSTL